LERLRSIAKSLKTWLIAHDEAMEQGQRPRQLSIYIKGESYYLVNRLDITNMKAFLEVEEHGTFPDWRDCILGGVYHPMKD